MVKAGEFAGILKVSSSRKDSSLRLATGEAVDDHEEYSLLLRQGGVMVREEDGGGEEESWMIFGAAIGVSLCVNLLSRCCCN